MRVVADTNVLVSALIFPGGSPEAVYRLVLERRIELVSSRPLLAELARVLTDKFGWNQQRDAGLIPGSSTGGTKIVTGSRSYVASC